MIALSLVETSASINPCNSVSFCCALILSSTKNVVKSSLFCSSVSNLELSPDSAAKARLLSVLINPCNSFSLAVALLASAFTALIRFWTSLLMSVFALEI